MRHLYGKYLPNIAICRFAFSSFLAALIGSTVGADVPEVWSYEQLFKTADVVVIAKLVSEERTKERSRPKDRRMTFGRVISKLSVQYTLKGKCKEEIKVYHFELISVDDEFVEKVPAHVRFRSNAIVQKGVSIPVPEYLLFLKKRKDAGYEFVSGDWYSDQSVREVLVPLRLPELGVPVKPPPKKLPGCK